MIQNSLFWQLITEMTTAQLPACGIPIINCSFNNTTLLPNSECFYLVFMNTTKKIKQVAVVLPYGFSTIRMITIKSRINGPLISSCSLLCDAHMIDPLPKQAYSNFVLKSICKMNVWGSFCHVRCLISWSRLAWSSKCRNYTLYKLSTCPYFATKCQSVSNS